MWYDRPDIKQWCCHCKEVVDATVRMDGDTGYLEVRCPNCGEEDCEDIKLCKCGEPMGVCDDFCPSCLVELGDAFKRFNDMLPVGMDTYDAVNYVVDNWM